MRGATLVQYRKARGLTQAALAELLGVSLRSVKGWEAGEVPARRVAAVSEALGVPQGELEAAPVDGPDAAVAELVEEHGERAVLASLLRAFRR